MHVIGLTHGHSDHFPKFENWINNSLNYGSRPYCRKMIPYDISIRQEKLKELLSDLMNYYRADKIGVGSISPFLMWAMKRMGLRPLDLRGIEPSGKKIPDFKVGFNFNPIGWLPDSINRLGEEEI